MQEHPLTLTSRDDHLITGTVFRPEHPASVLVIAHGMAEHAGRYTDFARWLGARQVAVVTYDHRGHGPACPESRRGHYGDRDGWDKVTDDLYRVLRHTRELFPGLPLTLLGHSMGSFIAQSCAQQHGEALDALILSATNRIHRPHLLVSALVIALIRKAFGARHRSPSIARMTFGKFNRQFRPNRTSSDWLSRDAAQVDAYVADPLCGFECTAGLWSDFIRGMLAISPANWRKDLPVHLFAGTDDPVGEMGKGITRHFQAIRNEGIHRVTLRLFDRGRHEMLNEINAEEVRDYILSLCRPVPDRHDKASAGDTLPEPI
ncbi:alpha/beta fold hydrolase [Marinobacter sp. M216]|uniref:Alpha/beta fold hydrolase n=1 Tax=Marinobacter albus TaxID=3030833 RepID=A0ABT7H7P1_9GAMM|nr:MULTISPECIES: alpha/beta fold hydrolase [unclassified Marinobacter]MBW7471349.1 lysophospholipase [Marinobacter sp. F4218]MDK9556373.1 alpha/beta fold hydrolase [Marinobacter sp. M216]